MWDWTSAVSMPPVTRLVVKGLFLFRNSLPEHKRLVACSPRLRFSGSPWNYPINPPTFSATTPTPTPSRSVCLAGLARANERWKVCPVQIVLPPRLKQVAPLEPLKKEKLVPHQTSYRAHSQVQDISSSDTDTDSELGSDPDWTPYLPLISPDARPPTDDVATAGPDDSESLYLSIDEENAPADEVCSFYSTQLGYRI